MASDSYYCQICTMDMSIARIRTPTEPPGAAWNYKGCNYVGFDEFRGYNGRRFQDQQCKQCTTLDRTPPTLNEEIKIAKSDGPLWPNSAYDFSWKPATMLGRNEHASDDYNANTSTQNALRKLPTIRKSKHLPHGTMRNGYIYTREHGGPKFLHDILPKDASGSYRLPLEHIAAPSCQSLQGINGHVLSAKQMKGCRNNRFLVPKPQDWQAEDSDSIFEDGSLFVLTGESNGSYVTGKAYYVYPPRYGIDMVNCCWSEGVNDDCNNCHQWEPLPVHSYCLDIFAKASYRRHGRVDLDAVWHWREMQGRPHDYNLPWGCVKRDPETTRGRQHQRDPWCHHPGDEWLTANPVEIPGFPVAVGSCFASVASNKMGRSQSRFLELPAELIDNTMSFLKERELFAIAGTCHKLRSHAQSFFKALSVQDPGWLWEVFEGGQYPEAPDWPATWDPCNPPGLDVPDLPPGPSSRHEAIMGLYQEKVEQSQQKWNEFRNAVSHWICRLPSAELDRTRDLDWVCLWYSLNFDATPIPGLRNRARIWKECERILDCNARLSEQFVGTKRKAVRKMMPQSSKYNLEQWWVDSRAATHRESHVGFLRPR